MNKLIAPALFLLAFVSCKNTPYDGYEKAEQSDLYYRFYKHDEKGRKPKENEIMRLKLRFKQTGTDSVLFSSASRSMLKDSCIELVLGPSPFKGSLIDGLKMMSVGDSASFIINADSLYSKWFKTPKPANFKTENATVTFDVKLDGVYPTEKELIDLFVQKEKENLSKYVAKNKIAVAPTATGLYYISVAEGNGKTPQQGDSVVVHYTGSFTDGKVFDSSVSGGRPITFLYQDGQVIPGWIEGLSQMKAGGKAKFIIPSSIAYGVNGRMGPMGEMAIPPASTLLFDIELVNVIPASAKSLAAAKSNNSHGKN